MIRKIQSYSDEIVISANFIPTLINMSNPSAGKVRYNVDHLEVYDGYAWLPVDCDVTVGLDFNARQVLEWAGKKMKEEAAIEKLKDNPAIADLLKQKTDIEEKIKMVEILLRDNNGTN